MGVIKKRVDDYLYNAKGEEVEGAEKKSISIPGLAFGGTRAKKHEVDLSPRGEKAHDKERAKLEEQTRQLWASYLKNVGFDAEKNAPKDDSESADSAPGDDTESAESASSGSSNDGDSEVETPSSGSGFTS